MNKIKFLSILMFMIMPMFMACGSDDKNSNNVPAEELAKMAVGTWMCTESSDTYQGQTAKDLLVGKEITIKADGTFTSTSSSMGYSGTYTTSGNSFTAKSSAGTFVVSATINGDKMTWNGTASNGVSFKYLFVRESGQTSTYETFPGCPPPFISLSPLSYAELTTALNQGSFVTISPVTTLGDSNNKIRISNGVSTQDYIIAAIDYRAFRFGCGGITVGTNYSGIALAYDLACPNCRTADYRLIINFNGTCSCSHCNIVYDLNNYGSILNAEKNKIHSNPRGLYRYHADINSNVVHVWN